jgi:hypothetical protein
MVVESCPFCGPDGKPSNRGGEDQKLLEPGTTAVIDMSWSSTGGSCQWADWASIFFDWTEDHDWRKYAQFLFIPSNWPMHICSAVRSYGYRASSDTPAMPEKEPELQVSLMQRAVYSDERARLHISLVSPTPSSKTSVGCATLYTVRHIAPSQTRFDPLPTVGSFRVASYTPEQVFEDKERSWPSWKKDLSRECDIPGGATSAEAEIPASDLATVTHVVWRTSPGPGKEPSFLSIPTHFEVHDVDSLSPNWGDATSGIRAGLSVDRESYTLGERIPLHLRWENVDASHPLGETECGDPQPDVEIQDSQHNVLRTIPTRSFCMGHGWGPFEIAKDKPMHIFWELTTASDPVPPPTVVPPFLPPADLAPAPSILPGPGVYYLVTVWSARVLEKTDATAASHLVKSAGKIGGVYATARSTPVRIEVVAPNNPIAGAFLSRGTTDKRLLPAHLQRSRQNVL